MDRSGYHDPYWRPLRPWSDSQSAASTDEPPYPVLPPEELPVQAELADPPQPPRAELLDDLPACRSPVDDEPVKDEVERRFSLLDLMLLMTAAAVLFALMGQLPRAIFAGAAGGLSMLMLIYLSLAEARNPLFRYGWWLLFVTYLIASGTAAVSG